jgi:hypothetical protein
MGDTDMATQNASNDWNRPRIVAVAGLTLAWLTATYLIGTGQLLANDQQSFFAPIAAFLTAYGLFPRFRHFVLSQDIRALTSLQHWRVVGFAFLPLYFFGVLPGLFAWPAGLGDVAVGVAAPFVVARLGREPDYVTSTGFLWFHFLGLVDFAVAIATAGLSAGAFPGLVAGGLTSAPMDVWPLNLFPSFLVPIFIILHLSVLLKVRHLRRAAQPGMAAVAESA